MVIFSDHYVNLTISKFKTLMNINVSNKKKLKKQLKRYISKKYTELK